MITPDRDPAGEFHFATDIGFAQLVASMGPVHGVPGHSERTDKSRKRINRLVSDRINKMLRMLFRNLFCRFYSFCLNRLRSASPASDFAASTGASTVPREYAEPHLDRAQGTLGAQDVRKSETDDALDGPTPAGPASHARIPHSRSRHQTGDRTGRLAIGSRWAGRKPEDIYLGRIQRPRTIRGRERFPLRHHLEQIRLPVAWRRFLHPGRDRETETGSASRSFPQLRRLLDQRATRRCAR